MDVLDLDVMLEALSEPPPPPPPFEWEDIEALIEGYHNTHDNDDEDDVLLLNLEEDVGVPTSLDADKSPSPDDVRLQKREKRKQTQALRFIKHGVEKKPLGGRNFLYSIGSRTVTSMKAVNRMCTAAEMAQKKDTRM